MNLVVVDSSGDGRAEFGKGDDHIDSGRNFDEIPTSSFRPLPAGVKVGDMDELMSKLRNEAKVLA